MTNLMQRLKSAFGHSAQTGQTKDPWYIDPQLEQEIKTLAREVDGLRKSGAGIPEEKLKKFQALLLEDGADQEEFFTLKKQMMEGGCKDRDLYIKVRDSLDSKKLWAATSVMNLPLGDMYSRADEAAFIVTIEPAKVGKKASNLQMK